MTWGLTYRGIHSSLKGLRISRIEGRDTLPEIESRTAQAGTKHGSYYFGHRLNEKIITVEINLFEASLANFRSAIRDLASWLDPRNGPGELIFDDEPDKKYYAVVTGNTDFEGIFAKRVAEIEFLCPDPFAYALTETVASFSENLLTIDNDGTAEAFPVIEITADGTAGPDNLEGKIQGSTVENPHVYKRSSFSTGFYTSLQNPNSFSIEGSTNDYDLIASLGKTPLPVSNSNYSAISQQLFSFNLIALIKRKFGFTVPGATLAEQVQWLKTNISQITANWWGKGTNKQADPIGIANFAGKVAGSTVENPHVTKHGGASTLLSPSSGSLTESSQLSYDYQMSLDGVVSALPINSSGNMAQRLFSFNLIEYVQRKYGVTVPGATTADKAQWLADNVAKITCKWWGYGSGPNGNKATFALFNKSSLTWNAFPPVTHSNGTVSNLSITVQPTVYSGHKNAIDANGLVHLLAHAEASDGTTASTINTDYVELGVELKAGEDKANFTAWNGSAWNSPVVHAGNAIGLKSYSPGTIPLYIDSDGFAHFLAYSEPSNGIAASTIETDYIELQVTLSKVEGIKVSNGNEFIAITRTFTSGDEITIDHQKGTITLNGVTNIITSLDIESDFFPLQPGQNDLTVGGGSGAVTYTKRWL